MPESVPILLAEDDPVIRSSLKEALEEAGFSVSEAEDGNKAIEALRREGFRGLVTDINLGSEPGGWEVARMGRELDAHLAVVYMTGGSAHEWASHGLPKTVLVAKPFAAAQVVTALSRLINEIASSL